MSDHVCMCISIPPKYAVSNVVGFIKGKSAISSNHKHAHDLFLLRSRSERFHNDANLGILSFKLP